MATIAPATIAKLDALAGVLANLSAKDQEFADDLIRKGRKWGPSEKQLFWIEKLTARAKGEEAVPERPKADVGSMAGVIALFDKAAQKLKHPAIVLHSPVEGDIRLHVMGETSRTPGAISVATHGDYFSRRWFGRIDRQGTFEQSLKDKPSDDLINLLKRFATNPAHVAAEHGKLTGRCCFCNTALTDERSTNVGYGPTCAKNYGLPWGTK